MKSLQERLNESLNSEVINEAKITRKALEGKIKKLSVMQNAAVKIKDEGGEESFHGDQNYFSTSDEAMKNYDKIMDKVYKEAEKIAKSVYGIDAQNVIDMAWDSYTMDEILDSIFANESSVNEEAKPIKNRARFSRQIKAMTKKSIELGFKNIRDAEENGKGDELKEAFDNEK